MFEQLKAFINKFEYVPEKLTAQEIEDRTEKSLFYTDNSITMEQNAYLHIKSDGTPILIDGKNLKIPQIWKNWDIDPKAVEAYKKEFNMIKEEKIPEAKAAEPEMQKVTKPKVEIFMVESNPN